MKKHRICIGTTEICGIMWKLGKAFDKKGIDHQIYLLRGNKLIGEDKPEYDNPQLKLQHWISKHIQRELDQKHIFRAAIWQFAEVFSLLLVFGKALKDYDTFLYVFTQGFFRGNPYLYRVEALEFFLLKLFRKKVISLCCGSDTRAPYCDVVNSDGELNKLVRVTKKHARRVHMIDKSTIVIDNPASASMHCRPYINYHCIGNPVDESECVRTQMSERDRDDASVVIFHAPSVPEVKGTYRIREVIDRLKQKGYPIEYREKSGVPHEEILKEMRSCDLIVNQLYSDTPLSMLDVEAALNHIPVITCGYYASYYKDEVPGEAFPGCFCEPNQLEEKLIYYIEHPEQRREMGEKTCKYVTDHMMADQIAEKMLRIVRGDIPEEWYYDPKKSSYIWGCGVSKRKLEERVYYMISHNGMKSLQVGKNTRLYKKYKSLYHYLSQDSKQISK